MNSTFFSFFGGGFGADSGLVKPMRLCYKGAMKNLFQALVFFLISLWSVVAGRAYILPAEQVLTYMTDRVGPSQTLIVFQKTLVYDPLIKEGMQELAETLYYLSPDRFRSEITGPEVEKVTVVDDEDALVVVDGRILRERQNLFDHFKDLILYRDAEVLADRVVRLGVDVDLVSLGRFGDQIVYVIGAKYPDESVPQVWVAKDHFRPLRFILKANGEGTGRKIEFADYVERDRGGDYPGRTLFYEGGKLVRMHVVENVESPARISAELFDLSWIRDRYAPADATDTGPGSEGELDEVRKSLEEFRRIFE